jgi:hypothetical protein
MEPGPFVYHGAPRDLVGHKLVSLYDLEALNPAAFAREVSKYRGRESAPEFRIPGLGRRFNDTVHCAPLHPWYILQARIAEGLPATGPMVERVSYRIPLASILVNPVVWYQARTIWINGAPDRADVPAEPPADEFEPFDPARYSELVALPAAYRPRIRESIAAGRRPLMFVHIPHVLVAGPIDLADAEVVDPMRPPEWERT